MSISTKGAKTKLPFRLKIGIQRYLANLRRNYLMYFLIWRTVDPSGTIFGSLWGKLPSLLRRKFSNSYTPASRVNVRPSLCCQFKKYFFLVKNFYFHHTSWVGNELGCSLVVVWVRSSNGCSSNKV